LYTRLEAESSCVSTSSPSLITSRSIEEEVHGLSAYKCRKGGTARGAFARDSRAVSAVGVLTNFPVDRQTVSLCRAPPALTKFRLKGRLRCPRSRHVLGRKSEPPSLGSARSCAPDCKSEAKASSTVVARREARMPKVFPTALFTLLPLDSSLVRGSGWLDRSSNGNGST